MSQKEKVHVGKICDGWEGEGAEAVCIRGERGVMCTRNRFPRGGGLTQKEA